jgi:saccharopine dehydrogenase-like NADP-dependent oxidoreductase
MLPADFNYPIARAALTAGCHFVSSSYTGRVAELDDEARTRGISILPEMGMDPGIDLVLGRLAVDELDEVHGMYSYGAGLPEPACAGDNPLHYKITWTFDGVLKAYKRPARVLRNGQEVVIAGDRIFRDEHGHTVEVAGLGALEAYPNGDAIHYIQVFNLGTQVREMGRFALRYPGHRRFWSVMAELGFLDDTALQVDGGGISPRQFLVRHLTPRLQFGPNERDMVVLRVSAWGLKDGRQRRVTYNLIDYRDLETGLFAMNRTVGYTASIGARMILTGQITAKGVLSPTRDVPARQVLRELKIRGMKLDHRVEDREDV